MSVYAQLVGSMGQAHKRSMKDQSLNLDPDSIQTYLQRYGYTTRTHDELIEEVAKHFPSLWSRLCFRKPILYPTFLFSFVAVAFATLSSIIIFNPYEIFSQDNGLIAILAVSIIFILFPVWDVYKYGFRHTWKAKAKTFSWLNQKITQEAIFIASVLNLDSVDSDLQIRVYSMFVPDKRGLYSEESKSYTAIVFDSRHPIHMTLPELRKKLQWIVPIDLTEN